MEQRLRADQLRAVPLFRDCSRRVLTRLASSARVETVDAGHRLLSQGAPSPHVYVLLAGNASVSRNGHPVRQLGPGDVVGELGVILDRPRSATVTAQTPIDWLVLDRDSLRQAVEDVPGLAWVLITTLAARLEKAMDDSDV
jgi:CRP/FNR family transcriptional regulator, cyclic AMP receptor protein